MMSSDQKEVVINLLKPPQYVIIHSPPGKINETIDLSLTGGGGVCEQLSLYSINNQLTNVQRDDAIRVLLLWNLAIHWVIKLKWQSNYKIPYSRNLAQTIKPLGMLISTQLELCIQCHSFLNPNPYSTAAKWFVAIARESQYNSIFRPINTGKTESLKKRREFIKYIANGINPISEQFAPLEWRLIETALFSNLGDKFDKDYLQPFIKSYRKWLNTTKNPSWGAAIRQNDKLFLQNGQGKGKILLDFQQLLSNK